MQKTAQKRSLLNRLREVTNVGGIATEKFFDPEFKRIMDQLRDETDDPVRAIVSGQQIGSASPPDNISLKDLLKSARSNFNRREYMTAIADLGKFHKRMADIYAILTKFVGNVDEVHHQFLFKDLDPETEKYLREDLKSRWAKPYEPEIVKNAGIIDFFRSISTERGRALRAWEKRYPKKVKEMKRATEGILTRSESLLAMVISTLKKMATARATRKVDEYISQASTIVNKYIDYDKGFKQYYDTHIKGFLDKQELLNPTKPAEKPTELGKQEIGKPGETPSSKPLEESVPTTTTAPAAPTGKGLGLKDRIMQGLTGVTPQSTQDQPGTATMISNLPNMTNVFPTQPVSPRKVTPAPQSTPAPEMGLPATGVPPLSPELEAQLSGTPAPQSVGKPLHPPIVPATTPPVGGVPFKQGPFGQMPLKPPVLRSEEHRKFFESLQTLSNESPIVLAGYIAKYAKAIEKTDPVVALKLFNVVKSIRG